MKKVALLFVVAVLVPSLVLAWLAIRSLRDQQFILRHQQSLLYQGVADAKAKEVQDYLAERQREFGLQVESLLADQNPRVIAPFFDDHLLKTWPFAEVGFVVSLDGNILAPSLLGRSEARRFRLDNDLFLSNRKSIEVYYNSPKGAINLSQLEETREDFKKNYLPGIDANAQVQSPQMQMMVQNQWDVQNSPQVFQNRYTPVGKSQAQRKVVPQNMDLSGQNTLSRVNAAEAEFRQLIGDANEGNLARFLQNKLKILIWYRSPRDSQLVFGAQLSLARLIEGMQRLMLPDAVPAIIGTASAATNVATSTTIERNAPPYRDVCLALLDDTGKPVARSQAQFQTDWKRPFVASEIGELLPHWEIGLYLLNPAKLNQSAEALKLSLSLIIVVMLIAIGIGGWLIVADLRRELTLARQKTDFVSNVSHELKTPLTSIRMFSELLAEGRVTDPGKRTSYLHIIAAEAARLTRLINNVLDFSRLERGEKKYHFQICELGALVRETVETYRPHVEANGFQLTAQIPEQPFAVNGDRDALAQIIVNLLSNAEKYSSERKEIAVSMETQPGNLPAVDVRILDRGLGVPKGCEEKIFEKFFRAHDALASGIQGSGLGLTLARQIARAHSGDVLYEARAGGGSCFILRLPLCEAPAGGDIY